MRVRFAVLLTCLGYLVGVTAPCPPDPAQLAMHGTPAADVHPSGSDSDGAATIDAPCECGCDKASAAGGLGKLGPALLRDAPARFARSAPPASDAAPIAPRDLVDPIDPPIPIAA